MEWYRLQKDLRDSDTKALQTLSSMRDFSQLELSDTAALMQELDLIVSIDTLFAHMAGALGKPVWILLPFHPDFRWLRDRADSPWYPTARLFRQTKDRDWSDVISSVSLELNKLLFDPQHVRN
jgi:ADP-heptose:LPS heptosyltransferase